VFGVLQSGHAPLRIAARANLCSFSRLALSDGLIGVKPDQRQCDQYRASGRRYPLVELFHCDTPFSTKSAVLRQDKLNPCLIAIERARQLLTTPSLVTGAGRNNMSLILRKNIEKERRSD
jgi:hypothetical protein